MTLPTRLLLTALCCMALAVHAQDAPPVSPQPSVEELGRMPQPDAATAPAIADAPPETRSAGLRVTVDFRIEGIEEPELTNAYNWLGYVAEDQRGRLDAERLKTLHAGAEKSIGKALQPYGYYEPEISAELRGGPRDFFARYRVVPGTPVRWTDAEISVTGEGADEQVGIESFAPRA